VIECTAMGRLLCALAIAAAVPLSGCVAITGGARLTAETTFRIEARGHSDDSPAHFQFRYADGKADLDTAAAQKTPMRMVPAHVPQDGRNLIFGEDITGWSPGRLYWYEVCGGDAKISPDLCGGVRHFFTPPTLAQDYVVGFFRFGGEYGNIVDIDAASGPQGQNADGWFTNSVRYFGTPAEGQVTCLVVNGNRAAVGVVGTSYSGTFHNENPQPYSAVWTLDAQADTFHEAITQSAPNCATASFTQQGAAFDWSIAFNDAN
jgi:hypothetical protein